MKYFGAHVSTAGGVQNAPINAHKIGATTFALFTKNQRQWAAPPLGATSIELFKKHMEQFHFEFDKILPHSSYLINLGNPDPEKNERSYDAFIDEIQRVNQLGLTSLNFHLGSHLWQGDETTCLNLIANKMNQAISESEKVTLVVENCAGQGSSLGHNLEQLSFLIEQIDDHSRLGVCIDTCHLFAAGVDFRTEELFEKFWTEFDNKIGFHFLKGIHLNDSKHQLNSRKDRHESLGRGEIGTLPFELIAKDPRFDDIPLILETPNPELWPAEIQMLTRYQN